MSLRKLWLWTGAYAPLYVLVGIINFSDPFWSVPCFIIAILGVISTLSLALVPSLAKNKFAFDPDDIKHVRRLPGNFGYFAPYFFIAQPLIETFVLFVGFFVFSYADGIASNPMLHLFGYRVYEVQVRQMCWTVVTRKDFLIPTQPIEATYLFDSVVIA